MLKKLINNKTPPIIHPKKTKSNSQCYNVVPKNFRYFLETKKDKTKQTKQVTSIFPPACCFFQHLLGPQVPPRVQKTPGWVQSPGGATVKPCWQCLWRQLRQVSRPTWLKSGINSPVEVKVVEICWNPIIYMGVSKNRGVSPKMDGENNGKPYVEMDDLGVPLFLETPTWVEAPLCLGGRLLKAV